MYPGFCFCCCCCEGCCSAILAGLPDAVLRRRRLRWVGPARGPTGSRSCCPGVPRCLLVRLTQPWHKQQQLEIRRLLGALLCCCFSLPPVLSLMLSGTRNTNVLEPVTVDCRCIGLLDAWLDVPCSAPILPPQADARRLPGLVGMCLVVHLRGDGPHHAQDWRHHLLRSKRRADCSIASGQAEERLLPPLHLWRGESGRVRVPNDAVGLS